MVNAVRPHCRAFIALEGYMKIIAWTICAAALLGGCGAQVYAPVSEVPAPKVETRIAPKTVVSRAAQAARAEDDLSRRQAERGGHSAPDFKDAAPDLDTSR